MVLFLKNLLFTVIAPGTVGVYVPWMIAGEHRPESAAWWLGSLGLLGLGASIYLWCLWDFATFGRGTPAPIDAPTRLVVRGLYHYVRNPMYVGVLTTIFGWAAFFRSPGVLVYALCVWVVFHLFVLLYEEPHLDRVFGAEYAEYRERVGRWLPRFG